MATIVLFHHVLGLTSGFEALADALRAGGHEVETPDMFDGRAFGSIEEGIGFVAEEGEEALGARGLAALPEPGGVLVVGGTSFGAAVAATAVAQRPDIAGMLSYEAFVDPHWVGGWSREVPVEVHGMTEDPYFAEDLELARPWIEAHPGSELHLYPGSAHLFTDSSTPGYAADATALVIERSLEFLARLAG